MKHSVVVSLVATVLLLAGCGGGSAAPSISGPASPKPPSAPVVEPPDGPAAPQSEGGEPGGFDALKERVFAARDSIWKSAEEAVAPQEVKKADIVAATKRFLASPKNKDFSISPVAGFSDAEIQIWVTVEEEVCATRVWPLDGFANACWVLASDTIILGEDDFSIMGQQD